MCLRSRGAVEREEELLCLELLSVVDREELLSVGNPEEELLSVGDREELLFSVGGYICAYILDREIGDG